MSKKIKKGNSIAYRGEVVISLMRGNKTYKTFRTRNKGGQQLFEYLGNCLIGNFDKSYQPTRLNLFDENYRPILVSPVPYNDIRLSSEESDSVTVVYSFIVPYSNIVDAENMKIKVARLYNVLNMSNNDNYSAEIEMKNLVTVDSSSNVKIEWYMTISNDVRE